MKHKELTGRIIDCAQTVHKTLGFGFLESVYHNALLHELSKTDLRAEPRKPIKVFYDDRIVGDFCADIVVEDAVILELKSVQELISAHEAQLNNYLKATGLEIGLLINFSHELQVRRKINSSS